MQIHPLNVAVIKRAARLLGAVPLSKLTPELVELCAALAEDLPKLGELAESAARALESARKCGAPTKRGPCPHFATRRDPLDLLWCDDHGKDIRPSVEIEIAPMLRTISKLLYPQ